MGSEKLHDGERVTDKSGYIHSDLRSSVVAKTAYSGPAQLDKEAEYGAWGETRSVSSNPAPTHQFVDTEPDSATGYYYFGARVYDPSLKRWLSPDPLMWSKPEVEAKDGRELNLYSYVKNNPVKGIDTRGLFTAIITVYQEWGRGMAGVDFGAHSAIYIERNGEAYMWDPAGGAFGLKRGTSDEINLSKMDDADLESYLDYHDTEEQRVSIEVFDTTEAQEEKIKKRAGKQKRVDGLYCTSSCRDAISGVGPFEDVAEGDGIDLPGLLEGDLPESDFETLEEARQHEELESAGEAFERVDVDERKEDENSGSSGESKRQQDEHE